VTATVQPDGPSFEPPSELPPPPETGRAVVSLSARLGGFLLELVLVPCTFVFGWVGWWIIAWADGQTPSKVLLHQHVVTADSGQLVSFGRMALREALGKGVGAVLVLGGAYAGLPVIAAIGVLYGVFGAGVAVGDNRRRAAWDLLAGTVVVEGDPPPFVPAAAAEAHTDPDADAATALPEAAGTEPE
jgi:hypothetical protein